MMHVSDGGFGRGTIQTVTPSVWQKQQQDDMQKVHHILQRMALTINDLKATSAAPTRPEKKVPEKRWHPGDNSKPYTYDEFWTESERQLKAKNKHPNQDQIKRKTNDMWKNSSPA